MRRSPTVEYLLWTCAAICAIAAVIAFVVHANTGGAVIAGGAGALTAFNASVQRSRRLSIPPPDGGPSLGRGA